LKKLFASLVFSIAGMLTGSFTSTSFAQNVCIDHFPNFITDVCWSCMFPMKIADVPLNLFGIGNQEDFDSGVNSATCFCGSQLKAGVPISFWEAAIIIDSHVMPGCLPTLAGITLPIGGEMGGSTDTGKGSEWAFRQSTYYTSPLMYLLGQIMDDNCSDRSAFNLAWTSELDPSWNDDELASLKMPIAFAFGSMPAVLAGTTDSIAANAGFPIPEIFWQAGSFGPMYPLSGTGEHISDDQFGHLIATRMLASAHDMSEIWNLFSSGAGQSFGQAGMCAQTPLEWPLQPIMDKRQYKISRHYPLAETEKIAGLCCAPIGRSTILSESGTQAPIPQANDYGYMIMRKRDCCAGAVLQ
jgi:conjugal transfer pilus assembly protein TraU